MNRKKKGNGGEQKGNGLTMGNKNASPFSEVFYAVNDLPIDAREAICRRCDWSIPTFYRKLKQSTAQEDEGLKKHGNKRKAISHAQMIDILEVYLANLQRVHTTLTSVKTRLKI